MEKDASPQSDPTVTTTSSTSPEQQQQQPPPPPHAPNSPPPAQSSSSPLNQQFAANFSALYHSIFPPKSPRSSSALISPSLCSSASSDNNQNATARSTVAIEHRLNQARLVLEYQQLRDHYDLCRAHLNDLTEEIDSLRRENARLRLSNSELVKLLNLPSQGTLESCFRRLGLSDANATGSDFSGEDVCSYSPTSVMDQSGYEPSNPERVWLPKSISVRSSGYLKLNQPAASNSRSSRPVSQLRMPRTQEPPKVQQRVYVPGGKKEQEALEFEVFSQGMFKTELCNKWQETGACPYGDHCQFAHGISELRPVIRHPRYKTEVCRMVLAGDMCPYGHRCHFRHSLTEQEMMLASR
ncbi:zinc finger CCCH domain-containing protein 14 [Syzygium oleosum]|uniref:zinc finger CCCH domain-containing protein 14 n=1 Tax=Syzygium oleosum TaxID=219896 RepID=UPI0024B91D5D|nr:zinc finger CCCH domain-containing protein 14 [Syzygium oleosum]